MTLFLKEKDIFCIIINFISGMKQTPEYSLGNVEPMKLMPVHDVQKRHKYDVEILAESILENS